MTLRIAVSMTLFLTAAFAQAQIAIENPGILLEKYEWISDVGTKIEAYFESADNNKTENTWIITLRNEDGSLVKLSRDRLSADSRQLATKLMDLQILRKRIDGLKKNRDKDKELAALQTFYDHLSGSFRLQAAAAKNQAILARGRPKYLPLLKTAPTNSYIAPEEIEQELIQIIRNQPFAVEHDITLFEKISLGKLWQHGLPNVDKSRLKADTKKALNCRLLAISLLGINEDPRALHTLLTASQDQDPEISKAAKVSLKMLGPTDEKKRMWSKYHSYFQFSGTDYYYVGQVPRDKWDVDKDSNRRLLLVKFEVLSVPSDSSAILHYRGNFSTENKDKSFDHPENKDKALDHQRNYLLNLNEIESDALYYSLYKGEAVEVIGDHAKKYAVGQKVDSLMVLKVGQEQRTQVLHFTKESIGYSEFIDPKTQFILNDAPQELVDFLKNR